MEKRIDLTDPSIELPDDSLDYIMSEAIVGVKKRSELADKQMRNLISEEIAKNKRSSCQSARP